MELLGIACGTLLAFAAIVAVDLWRRERD